MGWRTDAVGGMVDIPVPTNDISRPLLLLVRDDWK